MLKHLIKEENHGLYQLHSDVLTFIERSVNRGAFGQELFTPNLWAVVEHANNLEGLFENFFNALNADGIEKQYVYDTIATNNNVTDLCSNEIEYQPFIGAPYTDLNPSLVALFKLLWSSTLKNKTTEELYGYLDEHYLNFFNTNCKPINLCPFCGLERYINPKNGRSSYDHYLHKSDYPELNINFENLVPMPEGCNGPRVKGQKNVIRDEETNEPRSAYYPYLEVGDFTIVLKCNNMFLPDPNWEIDFVLDDQQYIDRFKTWKTVFDIEKRYSIELEENRNSWIIELIQLNIDNKPTTIAELDALIVTHIVNIQNRAITPGWFLHKAFWEYCQHTEDIIKEQILFSFNDYLEFQAA